MAAPYTSQAIVGYNSNPPADDGSAVSANRTTWSGVKTKLNDPIKTLSEAINTQLQLAFAKVVGGAGVTSTATSYSVISTDQGKLIRATAAAVTITTPDATDVTSPFVFAVLNNSNGTITLDGFGAQTVDGGANISIRSGAGVTVFTDGSNWYTTGNNIASSMPRGYLDGCILSNGTDTTNDINFAAGKCRDSTDTVDITCAAMAGKQLDANWAAGAAAGMRNSGAGIANTTYHLYSVAKADGTQDYYAHTSTTVATVITALQAETGGSAYIYARLIGSIVRASATILQFVQDGDIFQLKTPVLDLPLGTIASGAGGTTVTLGSVPTGIRLLAHFNASMVHAASSTELIYFSDLSCADVAPSASVAPLSTIGLALGGGAVTSILLNAAMSIRTNTSSQIRGRSLNAQAVIIATTGWTHPRGQNV